MYILMYVSTMLMLLVLMTYGRLEGYVRYAFIQAEFKKYMEVRERQFINNRAREQYNDTVATTGAKNNHADKSKARGLIIFNLFISKKDREEHPKEFEQYLQITRQFLHYMYGEQSFYKKLEEKRPSFLDELMQALMAASDKLPEKITKKEGILRISLDDFDLNEVFTLMLRGSIDTEETIEDEEKVLLFDEINFLPKGEYYSLLDFITIDPGNYKIRVYLAPPEILMVLFNNNSYTVREILKTRQELFRQVKKDLTVDEAEKEFRAQYQGQSHYPDVLNFGISKINPNNYFYIDK